MIISRQQITLVDETVTAFAIKIVLVVFPAKVLPECN